MKTYRSPDGRRELKETGWQSPGPLRSFIEWKTLRRWNKLPEGEKNVWGYLLRMVREQAGITQKDLGEILGITQQAVAQAERWTSNPTLSFFNRWCGACGCELNLQRMLPETDEAS